MPSVAPGQLLGYSLQFPRALLRLLEIKPGGAVGIEVCGDVSVFFPEGILLSEEDKSSICCNALTNYSTNLWKTFYNWVALLKEVQRDTDSMRFVLYTNHPVTDAGYAKCLSDAETADAVNGIIHDLHEFLKTISVKHDIFKYLNPLLGSDLEMFKKIIPRFELVVNSNTGEIYNDLRQAIHAKLIPDAYVEYLLDSLSGWLQKEMNCRIAEKKSALISFEEINHRFSVLCQGMRQKQLVDLAVKTIPDFTTLHACAQARPTYVKQLEIINADQAEIIEAVADFYRADTNRQEWIDREIIDEDSMNDFQGRLISFHANMQRNIELTERSSSKEIRGKRLLYTCQARSELLNEQTPPDRTIQGTYHVLSDEKSLGWHPDWENMIDSCNEASINE